MSTKRHELRVLIAMLFVITPNWKLSNCLSGWINCGIHTQ